MVIAKKFGNQRALRINKSEKHNAHQINMLEGPLGKKILLFALPLAGCSILQQLFNSTDVAVVGRFSGSQAIAAVGSNGPLINLMVLLFTGLAVGANVLISRYIGQREKDKANEASHTVILLSVVCGFFLLIIGQFLSKPILVLMNTPDDVIELASVYLRIYFLGMPFVMIYNFGSAILRSIGDTGRPLYCLIISGIVNVLLNLLFVVVFDMSVAGVGIATVIADGISAVLIMYYLFTENNEYIKINLKKIRFHRIHLKKMLMIGVPAGIQGMVFSISNVFVQASINSLGSDAVAGSSVALNFEYITYYIICAFSQTAVTFTSQNYGARKYDRCKKVFRLCMFFGCLICGITGIVFISGSNLFISFFTDSTEVAKYAFLRMAIVMLLEILTGSYEISCAALRGLGHSLSPAVITIFGSVVFRIVWIYTVFNVYHNYCALLIVYPISWVLTGTAVTLAYFKVRKREFAKLKSKAIYNHT
ncbi:MATE family efflux transporter [Ruminococcus sp.]|uniref:MATE family efflux transporter n=1 Tax=Ruminococcus sp. TaxID=41978 RepID=UPI003EFE20EF